MPTLFEDRINATALLAIGRKLKWAGDRLWTVRVDLFVNATELWQAEEIRRKTYSD
jgi:hypothetical protein